jgi:signal transduction histidine kinase
MRPLWSRSVRFRIALVYSCVLFTLAALVLGALYVGLSLALSDEPVSKREAVIVSRDENGALRRDRTTVLDGRDFERKVNAHTLDNLRTFSFAALGGLFVVSLGVGWVIAGRVLRPIDRITAVAQEIQATNLSRRIELDGPDDELRRLADTFDAMLDRLDASFTSQRQFIADASHELRNPLAIIQTNTDVALSDPDATPESLRRAARVVRGATVRMARLVDDLLALARLDTPAPRREPVDLAAVVHEEGDEFVAPAVAAGIDLHREPAETITVRGDHQSLRRAVANLLENALRHARSSVRLSAGRVRGWAWLAVADDGPGIAREDQARIFDRFLRLDRGRARDAGGSGLGLAIVRQIAEAHGGAVAVFSEPGRGATFVVWLPTGDGRRPPPSTDPTTAAAGAATGVTRL